MEPYSLICLDAHWVLWFQFLALLLQNIAVMLERVNGTTEWHMPGPQLDTVAQVLTIISIQDTAVM